MRFTDRWIENNWGLPIRKCRAAFVWLETTLRVRRRTFKGKNIASIAKSEAVAQGVKSIQGAIPGAIRSIPGRSSGMYFPTQQSPGNNNTGR